jgi:hypothetical protein
MRWRLIIVSPIVDSKGPLEAYRRIRKALESLHGSEISLEDISAMGVNGKDFLEYRSLLHRLRVVPPGRPAPRDVVFEDAYVYRW